MASAIVWAGSGSSPVGKTPFGYYDADAIFVSDAPKIANYCARRLGYPVMDVELDDTMFYSAFEDAINEYSTQVNIFNIRENMLTLQGGSVTTNMTHKQINPNLGRTIEISGMYGSEVGAGGNIDWKKGYIQTQPNVQSYDLDVLWTNVSESNKKIEVKTVYHQDLPASSQMYDPSIGSGMNTVMQEFGWGGLAPGVSFLMMPVYENMLRMQAIELNNQVRKSAYSFELVNNKLKMFPIPIVSMKVWFEYILVEDRYSPHTHSSSSISGSIGDGVVTDISNANYSMIPYHQINDPAKQWIRKYTFANAKEMLGDIRRKYSTIPIPNSEVTLNGEALMQEARDEKDKLIEQLRIDLERASISTQLQLQKEQGDNLQSIQSKVPMPFYIF